jgi:formylglycine-generating enzyme
MKKTMLWAAILLGVVGLLAGTGRGAESIESMPPVVVRTVPEAGRTDVMPGEVEIRVTFSKEMMEGSWSWCEPWKGANAAVLEKPRYESDGKTCVLKVKLEAGKTYAYWLNTEKFQNFRDRVGHAAVPYLLVFQTGRPLTLDLGNKVMMNLALVPAGKFLMGSPETEAGRDAYETQHEVRISKPFYMGVTHVTVDQFAAFVRDSDYRTDAEKAGWSNGFEIKDGKIEFKKVEGCSWRNPTFAQKGDHPVVQVTWNDAQAFCAWLSKKSGRTVELPTEAQWEYACRAGTKTAYPWGDNPDDGKGWDNCADQSLRGKTPVGYGGEGFFSWDDGFAFTAPAGTFKANALGLYDMHGNVWQWCQDRHGDDGVDYGREAAVDPTGQETGNKRVLRGGTWISAPRGCRSAYRGWLEPDQGYDNGGFRVVVAEAGTGMSGAEAVEAATPAAAALQAARAEARGVAEEWLKLVDGGKYAESWEGMAELAQKAMKQADWRKSLETFRTPLGKVVGRKLKSAEYAMSLPGAPDGEYVVLQYETEFEHKKAAVETITPMKEKDGKWKVSGYYLK